MNDLYVDDISVHAIYVDDLSVHAIYVDGLSDVWKVCSSISTPKRCSHFRSLMVLKGHITAYQGATARGHTLQ